MIVCNCTGKNEKEVLNCHKSGKICGVCRPRIEQLKADRRLSAAITGWFFGMVTVGLVLLAWELIK